MAGLEAQPSNPADWECAVLKVAIVYNRESRKVIILFGTPNRETIGLETLKRITEALVLCR